MCGSNSLKGKRESLLKIIISLYKIIAKRLYRKCYMMILNIGGSGFMPVK
jgi:hypothetical protein